MMRQQCTVLAAIILTAPTFFPITFSAAVGQEKNAGPLTIAEQSDFKSTSTSAQVAEFMQACASTASHVNTFVFGTTVEDRDLLGVTISRVPYLIGQSDGRAVALVIGNIHSGECAGKEALLMLIRQLANEPNHKWLENIVLVIVPNYNADANDRIGKNNRRGQLGPENGMGRRENAQNLDLNRDFVKLESPEARALVKLIDDVNPHLFIDCHTTNGSKHQYALTYDIPHNPATAEPIRNFLRQKMMPAVTQQLEHNGTLTFYYGNFDAGHTTWTTYGHEPRYSTEYVGLRGRLAILSEAYAYISYRDRIFATKDFVSGCLDYIHQNAEAVVQLLQAVDDDLMRIAGQQPSRVTVSLNARAEKFDERVTLKGFKQDQPCDYECDFVGNYVSTRSVPLPFAYLIPDRFPRPVDRLLMHGIAVEELTQDTELNVSIDTISRLNRNVQAFQKHRMVQVEAARATARRNVPTGTYVVRTSQPLGRLIAYLLECESDDSLLFWNFFDHAVIAGGEYPVLRVDQPALLDTKPVKEVKKTGRITLEMIGGPNSILKFQPAPEWNGDDRIRMELYDRDFLMDAESLSFVEMVKPAFESAELVQQLIQNGVDPAHAAEAIEQQPIESADRKILVFDTDKVDFVYLPESKRITILRVSDDHEEQANSAELMSLSPDDTKLAFVMRDKLRVLDIASEKVINVNVNSEDRTLLAGKLDWVYQEELYGRGNFKGYWWSPDSTQLAFLMLDESEVNRFTIVDHIPPGGNVELQNYPKAGTPNPKVSVGIMNANMSGEVVWVDLSQYDGEQLLVSNVSWQPDGSRLFLQIQNRQQTYLDLVAVNAKTLVPTVLFRDQTPAWIESPGEPQWLADGSFLWLSPRNGYRHLYHYGDDGKQLGPLTEGPWEIRELIAFDPKKKVVYFSAAKENPHDLDAYRLDLSSGQLTRITQGAGTHNLSFNQSMSHFIDAYSSATRPTEYRLFRADGRLLRQLSSSSDDQWKYLNISEPEYLTVPSANSQPLDAMIIRPPDFDATKKYPVLIHTYAGPQAPQVRNRFGGSWFLWHQILAQQGYIIWSLDNQSASYRSSRNVWPVHRDLGRQELADIERGVDWLKQQPWIDSDRIGIWGWSYGGFITAYALTHSDSFKIGIAGAPVTDWRNYDTIYTERLMGLPEENQQGYESSSVVRAAKNLSGKLLLIHGAIDDNVHLSNSMQLAMALQQAGKQFEWMIYPQNQHAIHNQEQSRHLRQLMFDFVVDNL